MKPLTHANSSVKKYGGVVDDYLDIHTFLDLSKAGHAHVTHRAIFHNALGPFIVEMAFGYYITNSAGKQVSTRQLAEDHIIEDLGFIPTIEKWLKNLPVEPWMDRISQAKITKRNWKNYD